MTISFSHELQEAVRFIQTQECLKHMEPSIRKYIKDITRICTELESQRNRHYLITGNSVLLIIFYSHNHDMSSTLNDSVEVVNLKLK